MNTNGWHICPDCGHPMIYDMNMGQFYCTCGAGKSLWRMRLERHIDKEFRRMTV